MKFRKQLGIAILFRLRLWFGIPFVFVAICDSEEASSATGLPGSSRFPWYYPRISLNADEIVWLIHQFAESGWREEMLRLNKILEQMLAA